MKKFLFAIAAVIVGTVGYGAHQRLTLARLERDVVAQLDALHAAYDVFVDDEVAHLVDTLSTDGARSRLLAISALIDEYADAQTPMDRVVNIVTLQQELVDLHASVPSSMAADPSSSASRLAKAIGEHSFFEPELTAYNDAAKAFNTFRERPVGALVSSEDSAHIERLPYILPNGQIDSAGMVEL